MEIAENIKKFIEDKASEMNKDALWHCEHVSEIISRLNAYLIDNIYLTQSEIDASLDLLAGYFTITLDLPLTGVKISRAVKYDRLDDPIPCYKEVSRLSYIPTSSGIVPSCGRLNKKGESMFYGCIYFDDDLAGIDVALAEIEARKFDKVNILKSTSQQNIIVRYIGIFDYVKREDKPYYLSDEVFKYYCAVYNYMEQKLDRWLFIACQLCDAFFADILSREGSERLYKLTSSLSERFMDDKSVDGMIYSSVKAKGSPVIALKPKAVDDKIVYSSVVALDVQDTYGYAIYRANPVYQGVINGNNINWNQI